jgi:hypothetical protein
METVLREEYNGGIFVKTSYIEKLMSDSWSATPKTPGDGIWGKLKIEFGKMEPHFFTITNWIEEAVEEEDLWGSSQNRSFCLKIG